MEKDFAVIGSGVDAFVFKCGFVEDATFMEKVIPDGGILLYDLPNCLSNGEGLNIGVIFTDEDKNMSDFVKEVANMVFNDEYSFRDEYPCAILSVNVDTMDFAPDVFYKYTCACFERGEYQTGFELLADSYIPVKLFNSDEFFINCSGDIKSLIKEDTIYAIYDTVDCRFGIYKPDFVSGKFIEGKFNPSVAFDKLGYRYSIVGVVCGSGIPF